MIKSFLKIRKEYLNGYLQITHKHNLELLSDKKYALIFLAADYNNLGDVAIAYAQMEFLKKHLPQTFQIIIVPYKETYHVLREIRKHIKKEDIVTLIGGGNSGTIYEFIEAPRRFILRYFNDCRIISFPQTVIFEDDKKLFPYKNEFIRICCKCKNLTLIARENNSYLLYKKLVGEYTKVLLTPDIVFSLNYLSSLKGRKKQACLILRNDKEKMITIEKQNNFVKWIYLMFDKCIYCDTCDIDISKDREKSLNDYLRVLSENKIAITDRLHGMIFCYITGTPCIVFKNNNYKIESTYNCWLKDKQNYIRLIDTNISKASFMKICEELLNLEEIIQQDMSAYFLPLVESIH